MDAGKWSEHSSPASTDCDCSNRASRSPVSRQPSIFRALTRRVSRGALQELPRFIRTSGRTGDAVCIMRTNEDTHLHPASDVSTCPACDSVEAPLLEAPDALLHFW